MKIIIILFAFFSSTGYAQNSIYDQSVSTAGEKDISLSKFKGQKILVAAVSTENLQQKGALSYWDSLQKANPKIVFILVPAADFSQKTDAETVKLITDNVSKDITISEVTTVRKDKAGTQNALFTWLTHSDQNIHFDLDVTTDLQLYVISESGILYAVLEKGVSGDGLDEILKQDDVKQ